MATSKTSPESGRKPTKGTIIIDKYRPMMDTLTDAQREEYYKRGLEMIHGGGPTKSQVSCR